MIKTKRLKMIYSLNLQKSNVLFGASWPKKNQPKNPLPQKNQIWWDSDMDELLEQQKKITKTFNDSKKKFNACSKKSPSFPFVKVEYEAARENVIFVHKPLVEFLVKKFAQKYHIKANSAVSIDDLRSVANMAIITAEKTYVPCEKGSTLLAYFWEAINTRLTTFTSTYLGVIRTSPHCLKRYTKIRDILKEKNLPITKMTVQEIAQETGYTERKVRDALEAKVFNPNYVRKPIDLNSIVRGLTYPKDMDPSEHLMEAEMMETLRKAVNETLSEKQRTVFYVMLENNNPEEVAKKMKITNKRIYQYRQTIIKKLQNYIKNLK